MYMTESAPAIDDISCCPSQKILWHLEDPLHFNRQPTLIGMNFL